jgi:hypothetical protein
VVGPRTPVMRAALPVVDELADPAHLVSGVVLIGVLARAGRPRFLGETTFRRLEPSGSASRAKIAR